MKQGSGNSTSSAHKTEPKSMGISPKGVAQIGIAVDPRAVESVHEGRGLKAPMASSTIHHGGSQGKHR